MGRRLEQVCPLASKSQGHFVVPPGIVAASTFTAWHSSISTPLGPATPRPGTAGANAVVRAELDGKSKVKLTKITADQSLVGPWR